MLTYGDENCLGCFVFFFFSSIYTPTLPVPLFVLLLHAPVLHLPILRLLFISSCSLFFLILLLFLVIIRLSFSSPSFLLSSSSYSAFCSYSPLPCFHSPILFLSFVSSRRPLILLFALPYSPLVIIRLSSSSSPSIHLVLLLFCLILLLCVQGMKVIQWYCSTQIKMQIRYCSSAFTRYALWPISIKRNNSGTSKFDVTSVFGDRPITKLLTCVGKRWRAFMPRTGFGPVIRIVEFAKYLQLAAGILKEPLKF